ncbi:MAG TPA: hypothetical protein HA224_01785 [Nanoarchaeota archaeon]|nr:hypothetical protein [Nanoarchaeota archaeon]
MDNDTWYHMRCAIKYPRHLLQQKSDSELDKLYEQFHEQNRTAMQYGSAIMTVGIIGFLATFFAGTDKRAALPYISSGLLLAGASLWAYRLREFLDIGDIMLARLGKKLFHSGETPPLDDIVMEPENARISQQDIERYK